MVTYDFTYYKEVLRNEELSQQINVAKVKKMCAKLGIINEFSIELHLPVMQSK